MQTSEHQGFFPPLQSKTKQNLSAGSSQQFVLGGNGGQGRWEVMFFFICRLIEHNWSQAIAHRLASKPNKRGKREHVYVLLCRRRLSTGWSSQGRRRCSTPSCDAPAKPSPYYLRDTTLSQMKQNAVLFTVRATHNESYILFFPPPGLSWVVLYTSKSSSAEGTQCLLTSVQRVKASSTYHHL